MAHFAILDENNIVTNTIVVVNEVATSEEVGVAFVKNLYKNQDLNVKQTSYNTRDNVHRGPDGKPDGGVAFRGNYGEPGFIYDPINDVFHPPRPVDVNGVSCDSWTLSKVTWKWKPPIAMPETGGEWDEVSQQWL